jgi:hypothetical protein
MKKPTPHQEAGSSATRSEPGAVATGLAGDIRQGSSKEASLFATGGNRVHLPVLRGFFLT